MTAPPLPAAVTLGTRASTLARAQTDLVAALLAAASLGLECETRVISGTPDHRDAILTESEKRAGDTMMICCSGAKSDRLVLDL